MIHQKTNKITVAIILQYVCVCVVNGFNHNHERYKYSD